MPINKYHARRTVVDGITFDSVAESKRYGELMLMQSAGELDCLELQPSFDLVVNGHKVGVYRADFSYRRVPTGEFVVEDVKGFKTPLYRLKAKMMRAIHGIEVAEVMP